MKGHESSLITFTENLNFDPSAASSGETDIQFMHQQQSIGEASSSAGPSRHDCVETKREHSWSVHSEAHHYELSDNLPFDSVNLSSNGNQLNSGPSLPLISSSEAFSPDLNIRLNEDHDDDDDDVQVVAHPGNYMSSVSLHGRTPPNDEDRQGSSFDGRRLSCKRKTIEAGPSSEAGNSSLYRNNERTQWDSSTRPQIIAANINTSTQPENNLVSNYEANPRLNLGVDGSLSSSPISLIPSETVGSSSRSFRLRVDGSNQQDLTPQIPLVSDTDVLNLHSPSLSNQQAMRFYLHQCLFGSNLDGRRNSQPRWSGESSSRTHSPSSSDIDAEIDATVYDDPVTSDMIQRSVMSQPMLTPCLEPGSSSQQPMNVISASGSNGSNSNVRNVRSASTRSWSNRTSPMYHRRLSELVRRSRLSSTESSSNNVMRQAPTSIQETPVSSESSSHRHHTPSSRSSFSELNLENAFGLPHSLRSVGASGEGRTSVMSEEIRHVLDLMRRGEGLRFEDVMLLDRSIFFNMANVNDRHRDMRMDVDNMSYEELLALGERIGNVCTGLKEGTILKLLKQHEYVEIQPPKDAETEPCSICREEYTQGENIGTLDCGHDFHRDCIKQWLMQKNLCPICKTTGLNK